MMQKNRALWVFCILFFVQKITAQTGFPLSQITDAPILINPAATGFFDDKYRIHTNFKSQIARTLSGGVKGVGVMADYNHEDLNMGFGVSIFSNTVNRSALRDFNLLLSYGYHVRVNDWSLLSLGVQSGFKQVGFNLEELTFGSQFDPSYKGGFNPDLRPSDLFPSNRNSLDASVGVLWKAFIEPSFLVKTGISAFHLIPVRVDFLTKETYLSPKLVFLGEVRYVDDPFHWIASVMHVSQTNNVYTEMGITAEFRDRSNFASIGLFHRTPNVIIPTAGIGTNQFAVHISIEYFLKTSFSQIFNISLLYFPQIDLSRSAERKQNENPFMF